jgi:hypothetical protein
MLFPSLVHFKMDFHDKLLRFQNGNGSSRLGTNADIDLIYCTRGVLMELEGCRYHFPSLDQAARAWCPKNIASNSTFYHNYLLSMDEPEFFWTHSEPSEVDLKWRSGLLINKASSVSISFPFIGPSQEKLNRKQEVPVPRNRTLMATGDLSPISEKEEILESESLVGGASSFTPDREITDPRTDLLSSYPGRYLIIQEYEKTDDVPTLKMILDNLGSQKIRLDDIVFSTEVYQEYGRRLKGLKKG